MNEKMNFLDLVGNIDEKFVYEASLPWKKHASARRRKFKIVAAAVILAVLSGGVFTHQEEVKGAWDSFASWIGNALGISGDVSSYIDITGKTITRDGKSVTIQETAGDKNNLWIAFEADAPDDMEALLMTEVYVDGKPAQLDGTYDMSEDNKIGKSQVCHYRLEDNGEKKDVIDIKADVWLESVEDLEKNAGLDNDKKMSFEFTTDIKELEAGTEEINIDRKMEFGQSQTFQISRLRFNNFSSSIYGELNDLGGSDEFMLVVRDENGNQIRYRMVSYDKPEILFEQEMNTADDMEILKRAKSLSVQLYRGKENKVPAYVENIQTEDMYVEEEGRIYEEGEDPMDDYEAVGEVLKIR